MLIIGIILFGTLFIFIALGVPLAFSLGLSAFFGLLYRGDIPLIVITQRTLVGIDSFPLLAIPLFYLMGSIMTGGGMTTRIFDFAKAAVGFVPGGLAQANVLASMLFAGVSGSAVADVSGLGSIEIPAMIEDGYDREISAAITASSAIIGPIIPPSIGMVVYGSMMGVSVGALLLGGAIPGVIYGAFLMVGIFFVSIKRKYPKHPFPTLITLARKGIYAIQSLALLIIVMGGIIGGVFTPTEAGAIGVMYASFITMFVLKKLTINQLWIILKETAVFTGTVLFIIGTASLFGWMIITSQLASTFINFLSQIVYSKEIFLLSVIVILLILGTFMETLAGLIMLSPLLIPIVKYFQIDPVHFGVVMVFGMSLGMLTPPVGECIYIASRLAGVSLEKTVKAVFPYFLFGVITLILIAYIPDLVLFLPHYFFR